MKTIGVTVMPEWFQSEGIEPVLDRLQAIGVTAITTSPCVLEACPEGEGSREPPGDAGSGKVRVLDRALWGKQELWMKVAPAFIADMSLYQGLRYQPAEPTDLTHAEGHVVDDAIKAIRARGMRVELQVQAAIPPGYKVQFGGPREEDHPRLPDGSLAIERVDKNGSLASPHIVDYGCALLQDIVRHYPGIDAIRLDWPEYPPYSLESWFFDFSEMAMQRGTEWGFAMDAIRRECDEARQALLGKLDNRHLEIALAGDGGLSALGALLVSYPALAELMKLKARLASSMLNTYGGTVREASGGTIGLVAHSFPPPWHLLSGLDPAQLQPPVEGIGFKLYTMHWAMMLQGYHDQLMTHNPALDRELLAKALIHIFDIADRGDNASLADLHYPEPDDNHLAGREAMKRKIAIARNATPATIQVATMSHAYGPVDDFAARFAVALDAPGEAVWVNRYGYLSDAKLNAVAAALDAAPG
ncbi:MAG: hypothetical protein AAFY56_05600 [Pseudomonadota bacterium]